MRKIGCVNYARFPKSSGVVSDMVMHVSLGYHVTDRRYIHRLVLGLVSCSQNLCHRALIH